MASWIEFYRWDWMWIHCLLVQSEKVGKRPNRFVDSIPPPLHYASFLFPWYKCSSYSRKWRKNKSLKWWGFLEVNSNKTFYSSTIGFRFYIYPISLYSYRSPQIQANCHHWISKLLRPFHDYSEWPEVSNASCQTFGFYGIRSSFKYLTFRPFLHWQSVWNHPVLIMIKYLHLVNKLSDKRKYNSNHPRSAC